MYSNYSEVVTVVVVVLVVVVVVLVVRLHFVPEWFLGTAISSLEHVPLFPVLVQVTRVVNISLFFKFSKDFPINPGLLIWEYIYAVVLGTTPSIN